jgi:hypothetical protein
VLFVSGTNQLASGTVTVTNSAVLDSSKIFVTTLAPSGTVGTPYVLSVVSGSRFTVTNTSPTDNSVFSYLIYNP